MARAKAGHVSLSAATSARLRAFCELHGLSMASVVENRVNAYLDAQPENLLEPRPEVAVDAIPAQIRPEVGTEEVGIVWLEMRPPDETVAQEMFRKARTVKP